MELCCKSQLPIEQYLPEKKGKTFIFWSNSLMTLKLVTKNPHGFQRDQMFAQGIFDC